MMGTFLGAPGIAFEHYIGLLIHGLKTAKCKTLSTRRKLPQTNSVLPVSCLEQLWESRPAISTKVKPIFLKITK